MPTSNPNSRPQTLRQAKRAYQKSSAKPKLSASELAAIERRAVLQERADRIRDREARRKANIKRKEERKEREREALLKAGKEVPKVGGIKVGPSQLDLARFLPTVETLNDAKEPTEEDCKRAIIDTKKVEQEGKEETTNSITNVKPMAPPPRPPLRQISANSSSKPFPQIAKPKIIFCTADNFDDLFVSNTQIGRELSTKPPAVPAAEPSVSFNLDAPDYARSDTDDILAQISTQDLDFIDILTQAPHPKPPPALSIKEDTVSQQSSEASQILANICTQDLDLSDLSLPGSPTASRLSPNTSTSFDYSDGFTDKDFECLAVEMEFQPSNRSASDSPSFRDSGG